MYRLFKNAREPMSSYTHFLGMIFSTAATIFLVLLNTINGDFSVRMLVSILVFGFSMLALYSASSIYHFYNGPLFKQQTGPRNDLRSDCRLLYPDLSEIYGRQLRHHLCQRYLGNRTVRYFSQDVLDERPQMALYQLLSADGLGNCI